jgi:hypothetical protein
MQMLDCYVTIDDRDALEEREGYEVVSDQGLDR